MTSLGCWTTRSASNTTHMERLFNTSSNPTARAPLSLRTPRRSMWSECGRAAFSFLTAAILWCSVVTASFALVWILYEYFLRFCLQVWFYHWVSCSEWNLIWVARASRLRCICRNQIGITFHFKPLQMWFESDLEVKNQISMFFFV